MGFKSAEPEHFRRKSSFLENKQNKKIGLKTKFMVKGESWTAGV